MLQIAVGVFVFLEIKDKNDFKVKIDNSITQLFSQNDDASSRELRDFIQSQVSLSIILVNVSRFFITYNNYEGILSVASELVFLSITDYHIFSLNIFQRKYQ